ncbi:hypothetical protein T07_6616 [Trichinella nelsoni]|uniref:Uncharacterized protein n=1 Tax=Trichinella nelsoni TaxID=6336 RepID=A0A0V0RJJ1_9BILA|nr:hypothetical protein T07_6616 [Trichinella nelsoni]
MTELGPEMEVRGGEDGEKVFSVREQYGEAVEGKCICGDYCKIASVNQVGLFVELTRECEPSRKIIRRLVLRKQARKPAWLHHGQ